MKIIITWHYILDFIKFIYFNLISLFQYKPYYGIWGMDYAQIKEDNEEESKEKNISNLFIQIVFQHFLISSIYFTIINWALTVINYDL